MVTILMTYKSGPVRMLEVAVSALMRYKSGYPFELKIVTDVSDLRAEAEVPLRYWTPFQINPAKSGSGQHGRLLDAAVKHVDTEYFLTLDSDCFPVADGWLKDLVDMQGENISASGILWPWVPAPETVQLNTMEARIRGYHCSKNTHPACQLIRTQMFKEHGWKFADPDGDDTNHGFMKKAAEAGMVTKGWMPTRCPFPDEPFDPEFNRHECLVFGDKVYHHVGATTELNKDVSSLHVFTKARERVYNESGAEWLLEPGQSHRYKMDREEEVAQFKMRMMYKAMEEYLKTRDSLFDRGWA